MRRHVLSTLSALALVSMAVLPAATPAVAQTPSARFQRIDVAKVDPQLLPMMIDKKRQLNVMVEMADQPVAVQVADAKAKGTAAPTASQKASWRARLATAQKPIVDEVRKSGGLVVGQMQDAYDGIHVHASAATVTKLAAMSGVVAIHVVPTYKPSLTQSVPFIGAPQEWQDTGFIGTGVKVAVIDTGVDFYHADFGGSGNVADYTYGLAHDTTAPAFNADGVTQAFPSAKIPVGYDLVGDAYDASADPGSPALTPHPDANPLDCNSHGTHTASTVAGNGVLANGTTYSGPYNGSTLSTHSFKIGPGVAPGASLYIYRVFGCEGSTDVVTEAINRAVAEGADVISMSLGSDFGTSDTPDAVASNNAAAAGVVVVAASGNAGSGPYITSSPGSASRAISVAAVDSNASFPSATIQLASGNIQAIDANGSTALPATGRLRVLGAPGSISLGCNDSDYSAVAAGDIVVAKRGTCDRVARAKFGQAHGASAVIMVNTDTNLPPFEGPIEGVTIPFLGVPSTAGAALLAADGATVTVVAAAPMANPGYKSLASFSSFGPREGDSAPKPEITAPGVSIVAAGMGTGTGVLIDSGTSMATPHVAGVAALVVNAHPDWTPDQVKGAIMSTADSSSAHMAGFDVRGAGPGVVQAQKAAATAAFVTTTDHLDSLAFGYRELRAGYYATKWFSITNTSGSAITYDLSAAFHGSASGATISVYPTQVAVPAHASRTVSTTLRFSRASATALPNASSFTGLGPGELLTIDGLVTATPTTSAAGVYALNVPFMFVPRGLSDVMVGSWHGFKPAGATISATVPVRNGGIHEGTADVYAWGLSDTNAVEGTASVRAVGVQSLPPAACGATAGDKCLAFAVNTWRKWSNASVNEFDVSIDTNNDGTPDFIVVGLDLGAVLSGTFSGTYASFTFDAGSGALIDAFYADAPMNGSTVILPALASDMGISSSAPSFSYSITSFDLYGGAVDSVPGTAKFDAYTPSVSNGDFLTLAPHTTTTLTLTANPSLLATTPAKGWMIVSLDNASGTAQARLIPVLKFPRF